MATGWFDFVNGQTLPASRVQDYLMNQSVMVFADATARTSGITGPTEGMLTYLKDTNTVEFYTGSAWQAVAPVQSIPDILNPLLLIGA